MQIVWGDTVLLLHQFDCIGSSNQVFLDGEPVKLFRKTRCVSDEDKSFDFFPWRNEPYFLVYFLAPALIYRVFEDWVRSSIRKQAEVLHDSRLSIGVEVTKNVFVTVSAEESPRP